MRIFPLGSGGTFLSWLAGGAALLAAVVATSAAPPATTQDYHYTVRRGGTVIGRFDFAVRDDGARREVKAEMKILVKLLIFPIYRATHHRTEVWQAGRLQRLDGTSVYNSKHYQMRLALQEGRYALTTNGATTALSGPVLTFVPWLPAVTGEATMVTEKGKSHALTLSRVGSETIRVGGRDHVTERYQMAGEKTRDLWFDAEGLLVQASYEASGELLEVQRVFQP